ncbi:MAG: 4Fe-4S binding protein [Sulfuricurvum sp.]
MAFLNFIPTKCVRALSINSICRNCVDICPSNALAIEGRLPSINHSLCIGCGGCIAVCPTEALTLDDFNPIEFFFDFMKDTDNMLSCQKNVPCMAALGSELLISIARLKGEIVVDIGHCGECTIGEKILPIVKATVEECNYLLEALGSNDEIDCREIGYVEDMNVLPEKDRRDFFKTFQLNRIGKIRNDFEKQVQKKTDEFIHFEIDSSHRDDLRVKKITDRRKLFFTALKRAPRPETMHVVDGSKIRFTSQKIMDESLCSACEMCYRICPTGALTSDLRNSKIDFDPFLCVKCHLCHDVCESDALTVSPSYNLTEWYDPTVRNLITFSVRRCYECDALFSSVNGEKICRRCRLEEEEARELWGI